MLQHLLYVIAKLGEALQIADTENSALTRRVAALQRENAQLRKIAAQRAETKDNT